MIASLSPIVHLIILKYGDLIFAALSVSGSEACKIILPFYDIESERKLINRAEI
jgi:hypothetical protein